MLPLSLDCQYLGQIVRSRLNRMLGVLFINVVNFVASICLCTIIVFVVVFLPNVKPLGHISYMYEWPPR